MVDLVFTDDTVLLDSLAGDLEAALVPPLDAMAGLLDEQAGLLELVVAARLIRRSMAPLLGKVPKELRLLLEQLPD
jgi:hypothetical protein